MGVLVSYLESQVGQNGIDFLRTDLEVCFIFASVAETHLNSGHQEKAERSIADAEKGYATIQRFLSDPRHAKHISEEDRQEFTAALELLRKMLDRLAQTES